jgi:hypothetical protein
MTEPAMKPTLILLALLAATPALAADTQAGGRWRVSGDVGGFRFELACTFQQIGEKLTGACTDLSTSNPKAPPKSAPHPLTRGGVTAGGGIVWAYQSSFLTRKFEVTYSGVVKGAAMSGTIQAGTGSGRFTARRE